MSLPRSAGELVITEVAPGVRTAFLRQTCDCDPDNQYTCNGFGTCGVDPEVPTALSAEDILRDYWGECASCRFWKLTDNEERRSGVCASPTSDNAGMVTYPSGHCRKWDPIDLDVALKLLEEG